MPKKFFDILPSERVSKEIEVEREEIKKEFRFSKKFIFPLFSVSIIFVGIFLFFKLGRAEIEICPKTELVDIEEKVILNSQLEEPLVGAEKNLFPAKVLEQRKRVLREFRATGETSVEKKAGGIIRVYNEYSTEAQTFVVNTRFLSTDGKLFRSVNRVTIPGQKYVEGKLRPGFVDIKVRAAEPGKEYNIGPTTFSIPGFLGTEMYTAFYAKSFSKMEGGYKGKSPQVTRADIKKTREVLEREAQNLSLSSLEEKCTLNSLILIGNSLKTEVLEDSCSAKEGENLDSFTCKMEVMTKGFALGEKDLREFTKNAILSKAKEKEIRPETLDWSFNVLEENLEKGRAELRLTGLAEVYSLEDLNLLKKGIAGKSKEQVKTLLEGCSQIKKAEVRLWPLWLRRVPENLDKIEVKIKFDEVKG